ncbi:hypothetical protein G7Y89_g3888 [Cudoniella acicularis]|uniref:SGNH hydrolase-type esterase domain-containing protein n=1 Tax=Cudoniella acicularis TaxID=354080 RepID=A0A8H4RRU9_9HELO|nr:hypothetical protein G7Y89_g3888 [Cudoniella acicularis]
MATQRYPQFFMLGDSHIQYSSRLRDGFSFGAGLAEHVERRLDVTTRGLNGYNTSNVMAILEAIIPPTSCAKIDYLLLLFGSNDSCLPESSTNQHVPLVWFRKNLGDIISHHLVRAHDPVILLVTPPPINESQLEIEDMKKGHSLLTRHQSFTAQYANAVRELVEESKNKKVVLIDLWSALLRKAAGSFPPDAEGDALLGSREKGDSEGLRELLVDGLHLSGAGYKVFLDEILPALGSGWTNSDKDKESWVFPRWEVAPSSSDINEAWP